MREQPAFRQAEPLGERPDGQRAETLHARKLNGLVEDARARAVAFRQVGFERCGHAQENSTTVRFIQHVRLSYAVSARAAANQQPIVATSSVRPTQSSGPPCAASR